MASAGLRQLDATVARGCQRLRQQLLKPAVEHGKPRRRGAARAGDAPRQFLGAGVGPDGQDVLLKYGAFLQTIFDFLIIALVLFMALRGINKLKKPDPAAPPPPPSKEEVLLTDIRDLLAKRS